MLCFEESPTATCKTRVAGLGKEDGTVIKSAGPDPEVAMLCGEVSSEAACKTCGAGPGIEEEVIVRPWTPSHAVRCWAETH